MEGREFIRTKKHAGNQKGLYPSMLVPIVQLIVVNSIQTYKNKNKKNVHSNTVGLTDATSPINQEIIIVQGLS